MNNRKAKTILLLSVVVPVGLLMAFKFEGLLGDNARISDTLYLEPVNWALERPGGPLDLNPDYKAERFFKNDEISIWLDATPLLYIEDGPFGTDDTLWQRISANISLTRGILRTLSIVFTENARLATVRYQPTGGDFGTKLASLRIDSSASGDDRRELLNNGIRAFINISGLNGPGPASFEDSSCWYLLGSQNQTHEMRIVFEITYSNGIVYKRLVQPFNFIVSRDNNDSFETAQEIALGYYDRLYVGHYDLNDFYKLSVSEGQRLSILVNATSSPGPMFSVFLYDSAKNKIETPSDPSFYSGVALTFVAPSTGFVFLDVRSYWEFYGFYSIRVDPA